VVPTGQKIVRLYASYAVHETALFVRPRNKGLRATDRLRERARAALFLSLNQVAIVAPNTVANKT
jgi:hypothetical protein